MAAVTFSISVACTTNGAVNSSTVPFADTDLVLNKLKNFQISTGDILRDEIKNDTIIGKQIINDMNEGKFVSDEIVNKLVENLVSR